MTSQEQDFTACVKALSGAFILSARALQVEIAVAFVVFHQAGDTSAASKKLLRQVYADAGRRDCLLPESPAYQTVMRRIGRCADLLEALGWRRVRKVLRDQHGAAAIQAVVDFIAPLGIESMDDVAAHAGRPRKAAPLEPAQAPAAPQRRRETDSPDVTHVKTRHIDVAVPPDAPASELVALANKLLALARRRES